MNLSQLVSSGLHALAVFSVLSHAPAQVPAHAVPLTTIALLDVRMVKDGDVLHALGRRPIQGGNQLFYRRSPDGGRTWPQQQVFVGATRGIAIGQLAVDGDDIYVATSSTGPDIVVSRDGGLSWSLQTAIAPQSINGSEPVLCASGGAVTAVWVAGGAVRQVFASRSVDGGVTWSVAAVIDTGAPVATPLQSQGDAGFRMFADGGTLHVVWTRGIVTWPSIEVNHTLHQRSLDGGVTWLPTANVIATHASTQSYLLEPLQPAAVGDGVAYIATDATLWRSLDQGSTWQVVPGHGITTNMRRIHDVVADGTNVMVFASLVTSLPGPLVVNASGDRGGTWRFEPFTMTLPMRSQLYPVIAGGSLWIGVQFTSLLVQPSMVTVQSDDLADSWRLVSGTGHVVAADADGAVALAYDGQMLPAAWVMEGHTVLGQGHAGTGGLVPSLRGRGVAGLGRTFSLAVEDALPNSVAFVFASFDATTAVPFGPATLYLSSMLGPFVGATSASGAVSFGVTIPANTAFAGLRLASQAFVFDSGAVGSFSATAAAESWIR